MMQRTRQKVASEPSRALRWLPLTLLALDLVALAAAGLIALWGRHGLTVFSTPTGLQESLGVAGVLTLPAWLAAIGIAGGYDRQVLGAGPDEFKRVVRATFVTAGALGVGCFLAKYQLSRGFFLLAFAAGLVLLLCVRLAMRKVLHRARRRGHLQERVLVAGTPQRIDEISRVLSRESWLGYGVIGAVVTTPSASSLEETAAGVPVLGSAADLLDVAEQNAADVIFLTGSVLGSGEDVKRLVWEVEQHGIEVVIAPSVVDISQERINVRPVGGVPLIHVGHARWAHAGRASKRVFDVVGSATLITLLSPVFLFAAVQIWLHDRGPLLFKHHRVGRHSERFECLKFRTMVVDAEAQVEKLQQKTGQAALLFKMKDDPRITKPGKWMRRFSVDELPQLFNVLRGDMSLVGPRPQVQREVDLYESGMERRLLVRPGMTGLWQVSGRNDLTPQEAMRLDVYYVDNWSMIQDIAILFRTVTAVFGSRGAY
ncbi:sugar transferase [Nocardioides sp. zg-536]|uniref:Sugar transferase n=1 Tax=Nocardioides faecalis TaxID=2803858 RepID=A0A938Y333_9ACTN|nr:sugar transferase [Nocardioides faecalis]MBM9458369.1 sugar transferase [Nocardioides faecalis]MBS4753319.1 sugar transferase [Nocardioides faecalis]QVI58390.1 sugar transferase [Nocardioides faecalis]